MSGPSRSPNPQFLSKGERVEVLKRSRGAVTPAYHAATVVSPSSPSTQRVTVEYGNRKRREVVNRADVRPILPRGTNECFRVGDNVDAYCPEPGDDSWRVGTVKGILENSRYLVQLQDPAEGGSGELVVDHFNLRVHRKWVNGSWAPPLPPPQPPENSSCKNWKSQERMPISETNRRNVRLKIKYCKRLSEPLFRKGTMVEVRSDEDGYQGAWYAAMIVGAIGVGNDKFLVQYVTLVTEDESAPLQEVALAHHIRPFPPRPLFFGFDLHDKVDAWFNEGWWEGVISKVIDGFKFMVYFCHTCENLEFDYSSLRPHQDWINGKWIADKSTALEVDHSIPREKFRKGTKIEVRSNDVDFLGAWFAATVIEVMGNDKFLVQYQSLLTDDKTRLLREEVSLPDIRPSPPCVQRVYPFRLLEAVDAWYNDGWWVGRIIKVKDGWKYIVHFETLEELEFDHSELRPHQEWVGGNWINVAEGWKFDPQIL